MKDFTDCPHCGKKTLVMRNADVYQCLSCDFKRDFTKTENGSPNQDFPTLLVIVLVTLVVFLTQAQAPAPPMQQPSSPDAVNSLSVG
jgi:uncharacterized protein (DUF983 family)